MLSSSRLGPGEVYRDSVYPRHCFGSLGLALEAGLEAVNLTEKASSGSARRANNFPWNLSGTYVQAMPYIFWRDARGNERNFLADYYRTTQELASNVFRKGYQWPFHATRMLNFGSKLVDLAIVKEAQAGRKLFMDFTRNLLPFQATPNSISTGSIRTCGPTLRALKRCWRSRPTGLAR